MVRLYDYVFYSMYKNVSIINKSIPKWSTIIGLSTLLFFNLISLLIYTEFDVEKIGEKGFGIIPLIIIGLNYLYFLKGKRYLKIIKQFEVKENKLIYDIAVLFYACTSIFIFYHLLDMDIRFTIFTACLIIFMALFAYLKKNRDKE